MLGTNLLVPESCPTSLLDDSEAIPIIKRQTSGPGTALELIDKYPASDDIVWCKNYSGGDIEIPPYG